MNAFSIIPDSEYDKFGRLNDRAKTEFGKWADAVLKLASCGRGIGRAIMEQASKLDCSEGHLRRKLDEWRETGDWKVFVNKALAGAEWWDSDIEPFADEFVDFWIGLRGRNQRGKGRPQYDALIRQWRAWRRGDLTKRIPGYDTPPDDCGKGHPAGWSYRNLMRVKPRKAEMALMTIGVAAALKLLPPIPGTRVGVRFLEYVSIDDVWQDRKVVVAGYGAPVRMLQMGAMDYASGTYLKFGLRPELPTDDGKRERLKERDAKELIAMLLEEFGYPADYDMHIICERGTATIREPDARALYDLSGGRIKVCYTSMEGGLVLAWQESSTGNSRGKGWHESWHNLFHNEMATLPGQVGKDNAHQPMALLGMEREAKSLITASHFLTPEQKQRLKLPFSTVEEAHWQTLEVVERINRRRKHDCEGFDTILEWVLPGIQDEPQPEGALIKLDEQMLARIEYRPRLESPWERMLKLRAGVQCNKIPSFILPRFYEDSHALRPVIGSRITVTKDNRAYIFKPPTPEADLPEGGKQYLCYFRTIDPDVVHLTDENGAFIGTWIRERRVQRGDQKAVAEGIREKTSLLNNAMATVRRVSKDFIAEQDARMRSNLEVITEAGLISQPAGGPLSDVRYEIPAGIIALNEAAKATAAAAELARQKAAAPPSRTPVADCTEDLLKRENQISEESYD